MTKRMILAGMLAMAGSATLAADTALDRKAAAASSTEQAAKQTQPKTETAQVRACTCTHGS